MNLADVKDAISQTINTMIGSVKYEFRIAERAKHSSKVSYHIVLNISADIATNMYIAQITKLNYNRTVKKHPLPPNEGFDTSIYARNKSLRLPNCGKVARLGSLDMNAKLNI